jgi:hypothetical protein
MFFKKQIIEKKIEKGFMILYLEFGDLAVVAP